MVAAPCLARPESEQWFCSLRLGVLEGDVKSRSLKKAFGWDRPVPGLVLAVQLVSLSKKFEVCGAFGVVVAVVGVQCCCCCCCCRYCCDLSICGALVRAAVLRCCLICVLVSGAFDLSTTELLRKLEKTCVFRDSTGATSSHRIDQMAQKQFAAANKTETPPPPWFTTRPPRCRNTPSLSCPSRS